MFNTSRSRQQTKRYRDSGADEEHEHSDERRASLAGSRMCGQWEGNGANAHAYNMQEVSPSYIMNHFDSALSLTEVAGPPSAPTSTSFPCMPPPGLSSSTTSRTASPNNFDNFDSSAGFGCNLYSDASRMRGHATPFGTDYSGTTGMQPQPTWGSAQQHDNYFFGEPSCLSPIIIPVKQLSGKIVDVHWLPSQGEYRTIDEAVEHATLVQFLGCVRLAVDGIDGVSPVRKRSTTLVFRGRNLLDDDSTRQCLRMMLECGRSGVRPPCLLFAKRL